MTSISVGTVLAATQSGRASRMNSAAAVAQAAIRSDGGSSDRLSRTRS